MATESPFGIGSLQVRVIGGICSSTVSNGLLHTSLEKHFCLPRFRGSAVS